MRPIEFRGLRKDGKGWAYGDPCTNPDTMQIESIMSFDVLTGGIVLVDPSTVGQFTGRHDIKKVKAFDGDIFKDQNSKVWVISWSIVQGAFMASPINREWQQAKRLHEIEIAEIIGNTHDNPELIKPWKK